MGRSGLRHVDNPALVGHFDTDTPSPKPGMRIPGLNVPHDGRSRQSGAASTECDTPINIQFAFSDKAVIDLSTDPLNASGGSDANGEMAPVRCSV